MNLYLKVILYNLVYYIIHIFIRMNHHNICGISDLFYNIYKAPISCKIMGFIIIKNVVYGFYQGTKKFNIKQRPITYLYESILMNGIWGCVEAFFWPITFPYAILDLFDYSLNMIRDKLKK
jgi:hypothetical protein